MRISPAIFVKASASAVVSTQFYNPKGSIDMFLQFSQFAVVMVFLAMGIIANAGSVAAVNPDLKLLFGVVEHYPLVVLIATGLLSVALQSSTASIGLGIGLAQAGLLPGITMVPWVLGANLGITLTMMIAGWGSTEGRRLAIGSLLIKGFGAILILLGSSKFFLFILNILPGAIDRKAANLNHYHPIGHKNSSCALGLEPIYGRLFAESV